MRNVLLVLVVCVLAAVASADYMFNIDPTTTTPGSWAPTEVANDGKWNMRDETTTVLFYNDDLGDAFNASELASDLVMTLGSADVGGQTTADVYIQYGVINVWAAGTTGIAAKIGSGSVLNFDDTNGTYLASSTGAPFDLYEGFVGTIDFSSGDVDITITQYGTDRSFPDAIRVTPEPATMLLLGTGALGLLRRRRS